MKTRRQKMMAILSDLPPGTFKHYKGVGTGIERSLESHLQNVRDIGRRIGKAKRAGCLIETILLRLEVIDFWLRIFYVNKAAIGQKRRLSFDELLEQCKAIGLEDRLYSDVKSFNARHADAIQGFLTGRVKYDDLASVDKISEATAVDVVRYVLMNCGRVIDGAAHRPGPSGKGDLVINVPNFLKGIPAWIAGA